MKEHKQKQSRQYIFTRTKDPSTTSLKYSNTMKAQENNLKTNSMMMIKVLKEDIKIFFKEIMEKKPKILEEISKSLKKDQEIQEKKRTNKQINQ